MSAPHSNDVPFDRRPMTFADANDSASIIPFNPASGRQRWADELSETADPEAPGGRYYSSSGGYRQVPSAAFDVDPDIRYYASMWLKADKPGSSIVIAITGQDGLGAVKSGSLNGTATFLIYQYVLPTTWTRVETTDLQFRLGVSSAKISAVFFNHASGSETGAVQCLSDIQIMPIPKHKHPVGDLTTTGTASSTTYLRGDGTWATPTDTNTTYAVPAQAEIEAGTATTARAISAVTLKGAIQRWATGTYTTAISAIGQALNRAANAAEARSAIGAGTSNLAIGTTASTAKAGNWTPAVADVTGLNAALDSKVAKAGDAATVWSGTQAQYDALPTATKNALGFIAVIR